MHVCGHSDMTWSRKRSACAGSFRGESLAAAIGRVIEAHCEITRDAVPTQMTDPSGVSRTLKLTRMSAEHVDANQSADKPTCISYLLPLTRGVELPPDLFFSCHRKGGRAALASPYPSVTFSVTFTTVGVLMMQVRGARSAARACAPRISTARLICCGLMKSTYSKPGMIGNALTCTRDKALRIADGCAPHVREVVHIPRDSALVHDPIRYAAR